ncbi:MAG: rhamnulokinase [Chitinispirillaceae bacterium]|nr:rhamnulokinase [Chitinispirillaceae bacterium]
MARGLHFLALDLGAESGRVISGRFDGSRLRISEAHRFASLPVRLPDGLHTDVLRIWSELKHGMALASASAGRNGIAGVGVDTWGVDFAFLDRQGALLSNPYHYRDSLTEGILPKAFRRVSRTEIFERTGVQFMPINTLYQLYALRRRRSPLLDNAHSLLMMADLFNCWLCGKKVNEFSIATTSQCYDPRGKKWAKAMIGKFGLPSHIFGKIVLPGTVLGGLLPQVADETGLSGHVPVIAPGCHDSALAVAAVPAKNRDFAYISCGTWSVLGAELREPCINKQSLAADFTNEGGVAGSFRFLKNLTGLWLVQESRREWLRRGEEHSYAELTEMAADAAPLRSVIDPSSGEFGRPGDMPERIRDYCRRSGQPVPESKGAVVRCALESLALSYRKTLEQLEGILDRRLDPVHVVGGGTQNRLLCRFAADATGRRVVAGPAEATAIGNVIMQAVALGHIGSVEQGRELIRRSFEVMHYEPRPSGQWDEAYERFVELRTGA